MENSRNASMLKVENLSVSFTTSQGLVQALRNVSFELQAGEALGFVGESGSGKSVTSLAILDLLANNAIVDSGEIYFEGKSLRNLPEAEKQKIRGSQISMIFQDPMSSLNPCFTVEKQIFETLKAHESLNQKQCRDRALELLQMVGIPDPQSRLKNYPHELSGGMSQRIMIAMAMACRPKLLIADEPTTALDVTIQKQILDLLTDLRRKSKMGLILISHDLSVIAQNTDKIMVMYAGEIVERGLSQSVISNPIHPYTEGLLKCLPGNYEASSAKTSNDFRLPTIQGVVPHLGNRPKGCQFAPRCNYKKPNCEEGPIPFNNQVRCLYPLGKSKI